MFKGLDILKFLCALLVVYIHTYCYEEGWGWIKDILSSVGVPFFFIASGFFFAKGLQKNNKTKKDYLRLYVKRLVGMYLLWTLITLPVSWMNICYAHPEYQWWMKCIYIIRCFFFTGSLGIYWYVLSLIYNSIIIYAFWKSNRVKFLLCVSSVFFAIGVLYDANVWTDTPIATFIHVIFGSERNFLNVGLLYMALGFVLSEIQHLKMKWPWLSALVVVFILEYCFYYKWSFHIFQLPAAMFLFLFGVQWQPKISDKLSLLFRKWSTIIYLSHFPFILVFDYYLRRGTIVDYSMAVLFSLVFYYLLVRFVPAKYMRLLYGC